MSGFERFVSNPSLNLMTHRLTFDSLPNNEEESKIAIESLAGLQSQNLRLRAAGGYSQQGRMIFDKRRSLDRALLYSYQAADIKKVACADNIDNSFRPNIRELDTHEICRALINPDKTKMNYDDKILSVHFEENYHSGDVFEWVGTNSYWMVYLQDLTETAYFRGEIRRCDYEIAWEDEEGKHSTFAAVRGPVETKIDYIQKHGISVDNPNHSLNIMMPRTKETLEYFRRYAKFYLPVEEGSPQVCWRVEATDWISAPGVLEVVAVEYYANETEDDIENGIVGGLIQKIENPNSDLIESFISGETFIKPKQVYEYFFKGMGVQTWSISDDKCPAIFNVDPNDGRHIKLKWDSPYSGQFELKCGKYSKTIVVESLY